MVKCCAARGITFRSKDGATTYHDKLYKVVDELSWLDVDDIELERVIVCNCPCHREGVNCLC